MANQVTNNANKLNQAIKLVLELLKETEDKQNKYFLVQAHNYLTQVFIKEQNL